MSVISIGTAGMSAASDRFTANAQRTAGGQSDPVAETVDQISDKQAFSASAAVIRSGDDMMRRLLDMKI